MASDKYGFKKKKIEKKSFIKKTPIDPIKIKPFHPSQEEEEFSSYEELKYFLQCQNPMSLKYCRREIMKFWHVEGIGTELKLFRIRSK